MTEKINDGIKEHHRGMKSKMINTVTDYNNCKGKRLCRNKTFIYSICDVDLSRTLQDNLNLM